MLTKLGTDEDIDRKLGVFYSSFGAATATNNILRTITLCLAVVACIEGLIITKLGAKLADQRPLIVRVDEVGKATPIGYEYGLTPRANEIRYFMGIFCNYFFSRSHDSRLPSIYAHSYAFMAPEFFHKQLAYDQQTHWLPKYLQSADPDVKVIVDNILVRNLDHAPYEVTAVVREQFLGTSGSPVKPDERHEVTIHFTFAQKIPNEVVTTNPLGILITSIQDDKTFQ